MRNDAVTHGAIRGAARGDTLGVRLLVFAFAAAPFQIWALFVFAGHGITLAHVVSLLFVAMLALRIDRLPFFGAVVAYLMFLLLVWGVVAAYLQPGGVPSLGRTGRNAILYAFMTFSFVGAMTVQIRWSAVTRMWRPAAIVYFGTVLYALYQACARRYMLPLAFLPVTNPTYQTDVAGGVQIGATYAAAGMGEYWYRASATFSEPSHFGRFLAFGLAVSLALLPLRGRAVRAGYIGVSATIVALLANYSLSGILDCVLVASVCLAGYFRGVRLKAVLRLVVMISVLIGLTYAAAPSVFLNVGRRIDLFLTSGESSDRYTALPRVLYAFSERPWGVGLAGVADANEIHNGFMLYVLQYGLLGLLPPLLWISAVVAGLISLIRGNLTPELRATMTVSVGFLTAHIALWMTSGEMSEPLSWICSGVAFGAIGRRLNRFFLGAGFKEGVHESSVSPGIPVRQE